MERDLWKNNQRIDKPHLSVRQQPNSNWAIYINETRAMEHCPCCLKAFAKREQAIRCADAFWPGEPTE